MATLGSRSPRPNLGRSIAAALDDSATLAGLLASHKRSHAYFAAARAGMPPTLLSQVRPGPIDEQAWTLFASTNGAAAKLRQCLPNLLLAVQAQDPQIREIRVKVAPLR